MKECSRVKNSKKCHEEKPRHNINRYRRHSLVVKKCNSVINKQDKYIRWATDSLYILIIQTSLSFISDHGKFSRHSISKFHQIHTIHLIWSCIQESAFEIILNQLINQFWASFELWMQLIHLSFCNVWLLFDFLLHQTNINEPWTFLSKASGYWIYMNQLACVSE